MSLQYLPTATDLGAGGALLSLDGTVCQQPCLDALVKCGRPGGEREVQ